MRCRCPICGKEFDAWSPYAVNEKIKRHIVDKHKEEFKKYGVEI